jgi:hypothetical protein
MHVLHGLCASSSHPENSVPRRNAPGTIGPIAESNDWAKFVLEGGDESLSTVYALSPPATSLPPIFDKLGLKLLSACASEMRCRHDGQTQFLLVNS